jgi:hypothetical protein
MADLTKIYFAQEVISLKFAVDAADGASPAARLSFHNKLGDNASIVPGGVPRKEGLGGCQKHPSKERGVRSMPT